WRPGVPVPAFPAGQDHFDDIAAQVAEPFDQVRQGQEVITADGVAALDGGLVGRFLAPVWLPDQHHAAGLQAVPEERYRARYAAADPGGTDARGDAHRGVGDVARRVAVREADPGVHSQLGGPGAGGGDEHRADVDPGPGPLVVAGPGAQHLAG